MAAPHHAYLLGCRPAAGADDKKKKAAAGAKKGKPKKGKKGDPPLATPPDPKVAARTTVVRQRLKRLGAKVQLASHPFYGPDLTAGFGQ